MSEEDKKVIDKIREEIQKKVLETGRHWIPTVNNIPVGQLTTDELRELLKEIKEKYPEAIDKFEALNLLDDKRYKFSELAAKIWEERAKPTVEEAKIPEGVTVVKFEMESPEFAEVVEECFKKFMEGYAGRSAVGYDHKVRFVMIHRDKPKVGYPIEVVCKNKENSIALRQTVDWVYTGEIEVVAVRRQEKAVEVAYIRKGIQRPKKEFMVYKFKKTDGWTLTGEPK